LGGILPAAYYSTEMLTAIDDLIARSPHRDLGGELYPNGQLIVAYRGERKQSENLTEDGKNSQPWACQQSLSLASDPKPQRQARGQKGITSYGKRMVTSGAALFERFFRRTDLTFGTATLPALTHEQMVLVARSWPDITRRFFEEVKRESKRNGLTDWELVFVVEVQIERWYKTGELALHLHWLCPGRSGRRVPWAITPKRVTEIWSRILSSVVGQEVDCSAAIRLEVPRGSLRRELGKYLSKGCAVIRQVIASGQGDLLPPAWWGASSSLKHSVFENTISLDSAISWALLDRQEELRESGRASVLHHFIDDVSQPSTVDERARWWVGASFYFNHDWQEINSFLRSLSRELILG